MSKVAPRIALLALLAFVAPAAALPNPLWSGTSGGFSIAWTTADLVAQREGKIVFSARNWTQKSLAHFVAVNRANGERGPGDCDYRHSIRLLAVVGSKLSLGDQTEFTCRQEAHPGGMTRLLTVDLAATGTLAQAGRDAIGLVDPSQPGRAVLLTQLFPASDVLSALIQMAPLHAALADQHATPATLADLVAGVAGASGTGDECYSIPTDLLASFAFRRLAGDRVVVALGLPGDGPCRLNLTVSELSFAVPASLALALHQADRHEAGFLPQAYSDPAAGPATTIILHTGRGAGE
jgi:hypothetical protein